MLRRMENGVCNNWVLVLVMFPKDRNFRWDNILEKGVCANFPNARLRMFPKDAWLVSWKLVQACQRGARI